MTIVTEPSPPEVSSSNGLYSPPAELAPQTRARALDINAISQAVASAFNKLPSEDVTRKGTTTFAINSASSGTAYAASRPGVTSYTDGMEVVLRAGVENTGPATLNVNSLGAIAIRRADGVAVQAADIQPHAVLSLRYSLALNAFIMPPVVGSQIALAQQAVVDAQEQVELAADQVDLAAAQVALAAGQVTAAAAQAGTAATSAGAAAGSASAASTSASSASTSATAASGSATLASNWAQLVGAAVTGGSYSAREWAIGTFTRGSVGGGSAKDWAQHTGSTVDGTNYSAKHWAQQAAAAIASAGFPVINPTTDAFKLMRVNAAGNAYELALPSIQSATRTSNTALTALDSGKFIDIISGTFTQTFAACAALGNGWAIYLRNSGTGDITLDPNGAETIDGLASFIMYPGECRLIRCDGATLRSIVLAPFNKTFISSAAWTRPPGYSSLDYEAWSGSGSGAASTYDGVSVATGGAGGAYAAGKIPASDVPSSVNVTIGAGGDAVSTGGSTLVNGNPGGSTTFGALVTVAGAPGGVAVTTNSSTGGNIGSSTATTHHGAQLIEPGGTASWAPNFGANNGESKVKAGAGGGSAIGGVTTQTTSFGGTSIYGGRGGHANAAGSIGASLTGSQNAEAGADPHGGGGGCKANVYNTANSGAGKPGKFILRGII